MNYPRSGMRDLIHVSDEVQAALEEGRAVVALETTLVAHGFPAPDGVETGFASEAAVRAAGGRVSIDLSSWSAIRDFGPERFCSLLEELAPDVVFANEEEESIVGGRIGDGYWIVKRGPAGASFDGDERAALPTERVLDSTGAGDAFAAGWLVGGPDLALEAAARCVQQAGSMPDAGAVLP